MKDIKDKILAMVKDDLVEIESALKENLNPHFELVARIAGHILFSGGKRLRPLMMVLCSRICGHRDKYNIVFSTIFEYLHAATLLHDDIVDNASVRRGKATAHTIWSSPAAVLVGDYLLSRSLAIAAETKRPDLIRIIAKITEDMTEGELFQLECKGKIDLSEKEYMDIIWRKTASLFRGACCAGAIIANASNKEKEALSKYGQSLGIAFQIADDLLDYTSSTKVLGKNAGADLKEGKITLPVIYSLKNADSNDRAQMAKIINNRDFSVDDFNILIELFKKYNGLSYAKQLAAGYVESAKNALSVFTASEPKEILTNIADYTLLRKA